MKLARCPVCNSDLHLDALVSNDATRELLNLISNLSPVCIRPLVLYIALFRPEKSQLSAERMLKLVTEVLALYHSDRVLAHALSETVERIKAKRVQGDKKPLSNHGYLAQVYQSAQQQFANSSNIAQREKNQKSGTDSRDAYFKQMQSLGVDVSTLPNGNEWLNQKGGQ